MYTEAMVLQLSQALEDKLAAAATGEKLLASFTLDGNPLGCAASSECATVVVCDDLGHVASVSVV